MKEKILRLKTALLADDFILTGSHSLKAIGFDVTPKDIDILLVNPKPETIEFMKRMSENFPPTVPGLGVNYPQDPTLFRWKEDGVDIDVWCLNQSISTDLMNSDGVKLATLTHIAGAKKTINRTKDWVQLKRLCDQIYTYQEFQFHLSCLKF